MGQLDIFTEIKKEEVREKLQGKKTEPYRNLKGELLPWEEPEYISKLPY